MYDQKCNECGKPYTTIYRLDSEGLCASCMKKKSLQKKIDWLTERRYDSSEDRPKTLEERISWIEEWILDQEQGPKRKDIKDIPLF